jgi:hypothetical protein
MNIRPVHTKGPHNAAHSPTLLSTAAITAWPKK